MITSRVEFSVEGKPRGWQRSGTVDGRHYVKRETLNAQKNIRQLATVAMAGRPPITGPVSVKIDAVFEMPESWPARVQAMTNLPHVSKPDLDNIEKLILDALNGTAWLDDAQVCVVAKAKRYGVGERVDVTIEELATSVDHPAVKRAAKRLEDRDTLAPMAQRLKRRKSRTVRAETWKSYKPETIGKRLK